MPASGAGEHWFVYGQCPPFGGEWRRAIALRNLHSNQGVEPRNAMSDVHDGGCLCRDIRYRAYGPPLEAIVCHCNFCQRRTGAAFGIGVFFPANRVEFTGSTPKTYEHRSEEHGRWLRLKFCPQCGTTIGVTAERRPGQQGLMGGTFDDRTWFTISRHIWTTSKVPWVEIPADVPCRLFGSA
jgi:hypothetical protein